MTALPLLPLLLVATLPPRGVQVVHRELIVVAPSGNAAPVPHPLAGVDPYAGDLAAIGGAVATQDVANLQWALDHVAPGGTVRLAAGTFELGSSGVYVRSVKLTGAGKDRSGRPRSVLHGGVHPIRVSFTSRRDAVSIDGVWLRGAGGQTIHGAMFALGAFELRDSWLTEAVPFTEAGDFGSGTALRALFFSGFESTSRPAACEVGEVVVRDSFFDTTSSAPVDFYDTAVQLAACRSSRFEVRGNRFLGQGGPIEIGGNGDERAEIDIRDNQIEMHMSPVCGGCGLGVMLVQTDGRRVTIAHNDLTTFNADPSIDSGFAYWISHHTPGANITFRDNTIAMEAGVIALGLGFPEFPLSQVGATKDPLSGGTFTHNTFRGRSILGIAALDQDDGAGHTYVNTSAYNEFRDTDFTSFTAGACTVLLGPSTHDNTFRHTKGLPLDASGKQTLDCNQNPTNRLEK